MTFFGITAVILVFIQICIIVRMNRTEQNLHARLFALENPDLVAGRTIRSVTLRSISISGPHWN